MRGALLALLLGGCLIVRKHEQIVEEPCPETMPELMARSEGPFDIFGADVYFVAESGTIARMPYAGGVPSELTADRMFITELATDGESIYWAASAAIWRMQLAGGAPFSIATGHDAVAHMLLDGDFVVWEGTGGLVQWNRLDESVRLLDEDEAILGLDGGGGTYFYSDTADRAVRRTEPPLDLAVDVYPGPLTLTGDNVYFHELENLEDYSGRIVLVPRDGGEPVVTARNLPPVIAMTSDAETLYFITAYRDEYRVRRVSRFGGNVEALACGRFEQQLVYIEVTPDHVWWSDARALYRLPL